MGPGRSGLRSVLVGTVLATASAVVSCASGSEAQPHEDAPAPEVSASIVQLRRDVVLQRVEVAVQNTGGNDFVVQRIKLTVPGFEMPGPIRKDSPVAAGQVVNLPVPYGAVRCPPGRDTPRVGPPHVTLLVSTGGGAEQQRLHIRARDDAGLLQRIATRSCALERVQQEVNLRFGEDWRLERAPGGDELHGTLTATLRSGGTRAVTQVAGAIMYGLRPGTHPPPGEPLALLTEAEPRADIPVVAYAARCDGHTLDEIKRPYDFLVWVGEPGGEEFAVTPAVGPGTKQALRKVCAF